MRGRHASDVTHAVMIVSANPETIDGLESYLRGVGMAPHGCSRLEECTRSITKRTAAVVLFPDDFTWETVLSTLAELASERAKTLRILVTGQPRRFERLTAGEGIVVVPRPAWGWTILDVLRMHLSVPEAHPSGHTEPA